MEPKVNKQVSGIGILDDNVFFGRISFADKIKQLIQWKGTPGSLAAQDERRQSPRLDISVPVLYQMDNINKSWWATKSHNLSETGIRISIAQKVRPGSTLNLEIKLPNMEENFRIKGEVVWIRPSQNAQLWDCGIAFKNLKHVSKKEKMIALIADQHCRFSLMYTKDHVTQPIDKLETMHQAYHILYKEYLKRGYCDHNRTKMHYNFYSLLPNSCTFSLTLKEKLLGTISVIGDSPCGLPMESIFAGEINAFRQQKRIIAEVGFLALESSEFKKGFFSLTNFKKQASLFRLYKIMLDYARLVLGTTDFIIGVHPKHETLYNYLGFESFGPVRSYPGAEDNPALPLRLDLVKAVEKNKVLKYGLGAYFLKDQTPLEVLSKRMQWSNDALAELLVDKKAIWDDLSAAQCAYLEQCYPGLTNAVKEHKAKQALIVPEKVIFESCKNFKLQVLKKMNNLIKSEEGKENK